MKFSAGYTLLEMLCGLVLFAWLGVLLAGMATPYRIHLEQERQEQERRALVELVIAVNGGAVSGEWYAVRAGESGTGWQLLPDAREEAEYKLYCFREESLLPGGESAARWLTLRIRMVCLVEGGEVWSGFRRIRLGA
jgi:hypothetical protein